MNKQCGFSLIEVMVTLVVLSIGLLGIAKLDHLSWALISSSNYDEAWH